MVTIVVIDLVLNILCHGTILFEFWCCVLFERVTWCWYVLLTLFIQIYIYETSFITLMVNMIFL